MYGIFIYNTYILCILQPLTFPNFRSNGLRCIVCDVIHFIIITSPRVSRVMVVSANYSCIRSLFDGAIFSHVYSIDRGKGNSITQVSVLLLLFSCNYIFAPWEYRSLTASIWIFCRLVARNHEEPERSDLLETAWYLSVLLEINLGTHLNASANVL